MWLAARFGGGGVVPQSQARRAQKMSRPNAYANSVVHHPIGRFVNFVGIYPALAWKNKAFGHDTHAEREGKLKITVRHWNLGKRGMAP